jgi:hypothetical protein
MKKWLMVFLVLALLLSSVGSLAESTQGGTPPAAPSGEPPSLPDGASPGGTPPSGTPGGGAPGGMPGGGSSQPESYSAVNEYGTDQTLTGGAYESTGVDENAILVTGGTVAIDGATVTRTSEGSTGGDSASFYGVGAAALITGGTLRLSGSAIETSAAGGAGVFAYGDGVAYVSNTSISTAKDASGGIHVAGGGTLYAKNLTVETGGQSAAAIRSDRGGGTMVVDGGTYTSNGVGSPAVYVTADISVNNAALTANGSEALCMEGKNNVRLYGTTLSGNMADLDVNSGNTWTVILYQSMSGDSEVGEGKFEMAGGTLVSKNGGLFYTTNTQSEFVLSDVTIEASEDSEYFLRCTGNANQRGWGASGNNGADCKFTGVAQAMNGDVIWDSISDLDLYLTSGSALTGAVLNDESEAGGGGDGTCNLYVSKDSRWIVTGDSTLTSLESEGAVVDADGKTVSIVGTDGTVYVQGDSPYKVTVSSYSSACDLSGAGAVSSWSEHEVSFE